MELSTLPAYGEAAYTKTFELPMVLPAGSCNNPFNDLVPPDVDDGVVMVRSRRLSNAQQLAYMNAHNASGAQGVHSIASAQDVKELDHNWLQEALHLGSHAQDHFHFPRYDYSPDDPKYSISRWTEPYPGMTTTVDGEEKSWTKVSVEGNAFGPHEEEVFDDDFVDFFAVKIFSTITQTVQLNLGYDDELMIWRDGELIFESVGGSAADVVTNEFELTQGWHQFLIKQTEHIGVQFWNMRFFQGPRTGRKDLLQHRPRRILRRRLQRHT
jgi:hypothetical protein